MALLFNFPCCLTFAPNTGAMTKKSAAFWLDNVYFDDTTVPVAKLFDHLKQGRSIRSFVKRFTAVDHWQVVDVLNRAGELLLRECVQAEAHSALVSPPGSQPAGGSATIV